MLKVGLSCLRGLCGAEAESGQGTMDSFGVRVGEAATSLRERETLVVDDRRDGGGISALARDGIRRSNRVGYVSVLEHRRKLAGDPGGELRLSRWLLLERTG